MRIPHSGLKLLAAATWYVGGGVLLFRGGHYLAEAANRGALVPALVGTVTALLVGVVRGRTLFLRACRRNLRRIEQLRDPRPWQFFRPGFFAALVVMIAAGAFLSWLAGLGYWATVVVGGLEVTVATGLLTSSVAFWPALSPGRTSGRR